MKLIRRYVLGIYNILLSLGALYTGAMMVWGNGIFAEYPQEWFGKIPFSSWLSLGIIGVILFGLGNAIAAIFCLKENSNKPWLMSIIMGSIFLITLLYQRMMLGEWYLATLQFLILSVIQLLLSLYVYLGHQKKLVNL
ncbi:hypothetical protein [Alkaliphilus serpentinus]|uniref:Uncharacterized protein n=1 Tax=Alkaliphilus serpentinus TaxID=1482731 RepID=A0A833ME03_9FIRM|nr:hypothetical protein [Alkaliphilus serpentinus]KAB3530014.1 hypothetical protein F8153_07910 [Alkaliphilus serpentinus]